MKRIVTSFLILALSACPNVGQVLDHGSFTVVYDSTLLIPTQADWVLDRQFLGRSSREPSWRFIEDSRVPAPRATHSDYTHSGYDRGHMCPAADRSASTELLRSTFIMTNVCPQTPALNRGLWKRLEEGCRRIAASGRRLAIHVDVVFWLADTQRIGRHQVAVPHGFVKTVRDALTDSILYARYFVNI